ncbi:MAG: NAD-dependent epimerase/dehydratase family protein, partial [Crocinitomicaceae bacterium]|nr:NAD-dependent epimerase/dehydratase family protein [Crocinitomicaceae bacterium]
MKTHLVTGGCGFVGRNMVKRLLTTTPDQIIFIDDLSVGIHPDTWLELTKTRNGDGFAVYEDRLLFIQADALRIMRHFSDDVHFFRQRYNFIMDRINDVFHFAAIVGGRAKIDGDPMAVALDLAIDAELFYWACRYKPDRLL